METATEEQPQKELTSNNVAIRVSGLSKQYLIGGEKKGTLTETLTGMIGAKNNRKEIFWALQDINFEVKKGEVIGIIGKNGAGKSTLLKILSRITRPTSGKIDINGRVASLLEVGTGFHPELTGRENVYLNGTILGMSRQEVKDRFEEIVEFSGVRKFIDTPVKHYSSGMYVRLAFAVAAHLDPEILIIDEVLAVGDIEFQKKCMGKMKDVASQGRTVIFVSHNMTAAQNLCNIGLFLKNGQVEFRGKIEDCITHYYADNTKPTQISFPFIQKGITIENIEIQNKEGTTIQNVLLGQGMDLKIRISNTNSAEMQLNVRFQIKSEKGELLTTLNTRQQNRQKWLKPGQSIEFICSIEKMTIAPGNYNMDLRIVNEEMNELSNIENVFSFSVNEGDFYNSGKIPNSKAFGKLFIEHDWI